MSILSSSILSGKRRRRFPVEDLTDQVAPAAGRAADVLLGLDAIAPGARVILACRESSRQHAGHLIDMCADMWDHVATRGAVLVGLHGAVASNRPLDVGGKSVNWMCGALRLAVERSAGFIVVESPNRVVRHPHYGGGFHQARQEEWDEVQGLLEWADVGVAIVSVLSPNATAVDERSHEVKRERRLSKVKSVKPTKPLRAVAVALYQGGMSYREVATELSQVTHPARWEKGGFVSPRSRHAVDPSTVLRWVRKSGVKCCGNREEV
jgi:hypothetical protein